MTTRRSFLKVVTAFLGALLPVHLLPKAEPIVKRFEGRLGWMRVTEGTRYKTQEDWNHAALDFNNVERKIHIYIGDLIDFSGCDAIELTPDLSYEDLESFTIDIPLDRRYWIDGTPVES